MADVADKLTDAADPTSAAIETLKPFVFPMVTALIVLGALVNAAAPWFFPFGVILGAFGLFLLIFKFFVGQVVSKIPGADTLVDTKQEGFAEKLKGLVGGEKKGVAGEAAQKALKKATKKAVSSAKSKAGGVGTLILLVIEYLVTPMNQFEQVALIFGLALFLPAAAVTPGLILGLIHYGCTAGGNTPDICSALPAGALDAAIKFLST
ncbi:MAG: hypothetical protein AAB568_01365 [Patescibacteria group bacterium]